MLGIYDLGRILAFSAFLAPTLATAQELCKSVHLDLAAGLAFKMCLINSDGARNGDLLVRVENLDTRAKEVNVTNCYTIIDGLLETGGWSIKLNREKPRNHYVVAFNLNEYQQRMWSAYSTERCIYRWEYAGESPSSRPPQCPGLQVYRNGSCRSVLRSSPG